VAVAAATTGQPVMLIVLVQVPFFLLSMTMGALRLNRLLVATMVAERDSERRSLHDPLTGLLNRAGLERGFAGWRGDTLLYIDLNRFKQINDIHGHAAGDALLREYGRRLQAIAGAAAIVARVGGDEFVVLSDRIMADDADRWRDTIAAVLGQPFPWREATLRSGGSIGMARGGDGRSLETLMAAADDELYRLKAGRTASVRSTSSAGAR
jgi:diguanylate cyclase (GGDEF)-like protein